MVGVVAHPKRAPDDLRHAPRRPDVAPEALRLGPARQQAGQLGPLLRPQARGRPRLRPGAQRLRAALPPALEPLTDRSAADAQSRGNVLLPPALLM